MQLISVDSAKHTDTSGAFELSITADLDDGNGPVSSIPYGWDQNLRDPHGLYPQVDAWMAAHPDFAVAAYVPPVIMADQVTTEAQRRFMLATADARALNQVLGTPIPAAIVTLGQAIITEGTTLAAMTPIPADYTSDIYWPS